MQLFGTSGIRRIFDAELVQLAFRVGLAVGKTCGDTVVGADPRTSSDALKHAVISGLLASGAGCSDAGMVPTPTLALAAREYGAGVMITASHNPPEYNGLKLLNPDGSSFGDAQQRQMEEMLAGDSLTAADWPAVKQSNNYEEAVPRHIARVLGDFYGDFRVKAVVDAGGGAASEVTPYLLGKMGCEVLTVNCSPGGFFPRGIEPAEENLRELMGAVKESGADLGIAHDGDADRMMAVDERGRLISGDRLLVLLARALGAKRVVTTVDASMAIEEASFDVVRTKVGDTAVSEELARRGDFGGEPSGSWVFPGISLCPDGIYAAAQVAAIASRHRLSELAEGVPSYSVVRGSVQTDGQVPASFGSVLASLRPLSVSNTDGIKLHFDDGWLLVRPSGTEPRIRLTAEAKSEARARQIYDSAMEIIGKSLGRPS